MCKQEELFVYCVCLSLPVFPPQYPHASILTPVSSRQYPHAKRNKAQTRDGAQARDGKSARERESERESEKEYEKSLS